MNNSKQCCIQFAEKRSFSFLFIELHGDDAQQISVTGDRLVTTPNKKFHDFLSFLDHYISFVQSVILFLRFSTEVM